MRFVRKVTERGTVTLPIEVREALGIEEGDIVELEILRTTKASALRQTLKGGLSSQAPVVNLVKKVGALQGEPHAP